MVKNRGVAELVDASCKSCGAGDPGTWPPTCRFESYLPDQNMFPAHGVPTGSRNYASQVSSRDIGQILLLKETSI